MQVMASDADDPTYGSSARVVYSVLEGEQHFSVDSKTGQCQGGSAGSSSWAGVGRSVGVLLRGTRETPAGQGTQGALLQRPGLRALCWTGSLGGLGPLSLSDSWRGAWRGAAVGHAAAGLSGGPRKVAPDVQVGSRGCLVFPISGVPALPTVQPSWPGVRRGSLVSPEPLIKGSTLN